MLSDGQYAMVFPSAIALGIVLGLALVALTIVLTKRKPQFDRVALLAAFSYEAFWAAVATACEAIFVGKNWVGGGVVATLAFMTMGLPVSLIFIVWFILFPISLVSSAVALSPLVGIFLLAFYFTDPRGWRGGKVTDNNQRLESPSATDG